MADTDIDSNQKRIRKIVDDIKDGHIKIPDFQRPFVWDGEQVIELLDSVYKDYPIGSILLWKTKEKQLNPLRNIGGIVLPKPEEDYPINYVLDGQQRLSSLFAVLHHGADEVDREIEKVGVDDYEKFNIYFDLEENNFKHESDLPNLKGPLFNQDESRFFKMSNLRRPDKYRKKAREIPQKYVHEADDLINKFENYEIPIVTVKGREESEVGTIFERINNTGTDLDTLDLMIALTWSKDFNLREEIDNTLHKLSDKGFGDIRSKIILQCISAIHNNHISTDDIQRALKESSNIEYRVNTLKDSLEKSIDFLRTQLNVYSLKFLPSSFQIIPLVYLFSKVDVLSQYQREMTQKWFWRTSFTTRYRDSTNYRVESDISFFEDLSRKEEVSLEGYNTDVISEDFFANCKFHRSAAVTKAFVLMLSRENPRDLLEGHKVSTEDTFSESDFSGENHHVFPRGYLRHKEYKEKTINSLANVCLLSSSSNRAVSDSPPSDYLFDEDAPLFDDGQKQPEVGPDILKSNLLPTDISIYREDDFDRFISERSTLLYNYFQKLIR